MRSHLLATWGWVIVLLTMLITPLPVRAETGGASHADVVILLDRSGSMARNDPEDRSLVGAILFVGMLDPGDRVSILTFDATVKTVLPLSTVGDGSAARKAIAAIGKPAGAWTDLKAGVTAALQQFDGQARPDRQPTVLLFTDGRPEVQNDGVPAGYSEELQREVGRLTGRAVPLFAIGLGQADFGLLGRLAASTHGESFTAAGEGNVVPLFTDILSRVKDRQVLISLQEDGPGGAVRTFRVPPYTRLLTLSAVGSGDLKVDGKAPDGTGLASVAGLKVATGANYLVYTIADPVPGVWQVRVTGAGRVQLQGQAENALRLSLQKPLPYAEVDSTKPVPVTVAVSGDPDPTSPLEVWAQPGLMSGQPSAPVQLSRQGEAFSAEVSLSDGRLIVWATRGGVELTRREFRLYPGAAAQTKRGPIDAPVAPAIWPKWIVATGMAVGAVFCALAAGAWNWHRLRRREEQLGGRLGDLLLTGLGREVGVALGPVVAGPGTLPRAMMTARLVPTVWAPLTGLGFGGRHLQIHIRPVPGIRFQVNGRPAADGRLYHGDELYLGEERYTYQNAALPRRPAREGRRPLRVRTNRLRG